MFGLKKKTMIIGGLVAVLAGGTAFATKSYLGGDRATRVIERVSDHLDLDANQKQAFTKVVGTFKDMRADAPAFMLDLSDKVKTLAKDSDLTIDEVNVLRDQIKAEFDRRVDALVPEIVSFYNTLNDEQRSTIAKRLEKVSDRVEHRMEKRVKRGQNGDDD